MVFEHIYVALLAQLSILFPCLKINIFFTLSTQYTPLEQHVWKARDVHTIAKLYFVLFRMVIYSLSSIREKRLFNFESDIIG